MNKKTYKTLEFYKVLDEVKKYCVTREGRHLIHNLTPFSTSYEIEENLKETEESLNILCAKGAPPLEGLGDLKEAIERANKGGILSLAEILKVGRALKCARRLKEFMKGEEELELYPKISDYVSILESIKWLEDEIDISVISEDELSDRASSTLYSLRRNIKEKNASVRDKIGAIVKSNAKYLQDSLYTMRGDRYVLPVKAEYKGAVPGLVHDQSSTGATLFIEPMSLVNLNNEIKELVLKEKKEIERILMDFTDKICRNIEIIDSNNKIITKLDYIFAKGKYGREIEGSVPRINEDNSFSLISARHPLISKDIVVSSDIYLGKDFSTMTITGPNTGGKTVTLKTVGLIHLMGLSGLLIPAMEGSSINLYKRIFADIGDEQSIEQSLSTFSSHLKNIVGILAKADSESLVLFDELGAGTDPTEGAALAISILEDLRKRGTSIIATTHYSELKGYALKTNGVENASVEFNVETLRPTYRLIIGIPGKSNAFEISKRLGVNVEIIEAAKGYMDKDNLQFEDLIRDLQEKSSRAHRFEREAMEQRGRAEKLKKEYEEKLNRLNKVRDKAYEEARREAKDIISKAKDEADDILKAMRELEKLGIDGGGRKRLEEERRKLKESLDSKERALIKERENSGEELKKVNVGEEAFLPKLNQRVVILSLPDSKGEVQVEAGIMKINVKLKDLRKVQGETKKAEKKKREVRLNLSAVETRIDVRGLDAEEAIFRVDKYLDEAYLGNLGEVTIVHGKGTGVLRKTMGDMLKRHGHVKSYRLGVYGEGGDGVTIVELK